MVSPCRFYVRLHLKDPRHFTTVDRSLSLRSLEALETLNIDIRIIQETHVLDDSAWKFLANTLASLPNRSSLRSMYLTALVNVPIADEDEDVSKPVQGLSEQSQPSAWGGLIRVLRDFGCLSLVKLRLAPDRTGTRDTDHLPQQRITKDNFPWIVQKLFGRQHLDLFPADVSFTAHITFGHDQ